MCSFLTFQLPLHITDSNFSDRRKKEDVAWAEVAQFYNAHQANVLASINQRNRTRTPADGKAKGKQRATSQEPEDLEPRENELPDVFRGPKGYDVAKHILGLGFDGVGKGDPRLEELRYMVCCWLHLYV